MKSMFLPLLFSLIILCSCSDENPSAPQIDLSMFSGNWSGTQTILQAGQCSISGGDSISVPITLTWVVDNNGNVTIQNPQSGNESWSGKVEPNMDISLEKSFSVNCFGTVRNETSSYNGTIEQKSGSFTVNMEAIEDWCPPACIFRIRYSLVKQ